MHAGIILNLISNNPGKAQALGFFFFFSDRVSPWAVLECKRRVKKYLCGGQMLTAAGHTTGNYIFSTEQAINFFSIHYCAK